MSQKSNLIPLFPKCIYLKDNVCVDHLSDFENSARNLKNQTRKNPLLNVNSSHTINSSIHKKFPFDILEKEIMKHARVFMLDYGYTSNRISDAFIQSMWFNISGKGDFLFPHIHYGSLISGAYYIKTTKENVILFHDDHKNFYEDPQNMNMFSETVKPFECKEGRLIMFSSDMMHSTPPQTLEGEKIVVSFNIVLENKR